MRELRKSKLGVQKLPSLSADLYLQGYSESEIDLAFSWLFERIESGDVHLEALQTTHTPSALRMLNNTEKMVINAEAHSFLLQIRGLDLIDDQQLEQSIERAMLLGIRSINEEDMREIVAMVMFEEQFLNDNFFFDGNQLAH